MRALPRSYGDISSFTRSPTVSRMNLFRILPEIWARTRCWLESSTRNIVPGRTVTIFPSVTIESSVGIDRVVVPLEIVVKIETLRFVLEETGEVRTSPANSTAPSPLTRPSNRDNPVLIAPIGSANRKSSAVRSRSGLTPALAERTLIAAERSRFALFFRARFVYGQSAIIE
jgi:hypothetical protein